MTPLTAKKKRTPPAKGLSGPIKSSPPSAKRTASKWANDEQGDEIPLRPYARLLTMLGDQLIRNERVALVELIKNAYDADASWVKVTFENFDEEFVPTATSKIIIEDDGVGMSESIIRDHWANPATPMKLLTKATGGRSPGGRIIQGEKGIGRFALLKLGRNIQITTRTAKGDEERVVTLNLSGYDTDFLEDGKPLFLDNLRVGLKKVKPASVIVRETIKLGARRKSRKPFGTRIEISHLTSTWSRKKVEGVYEDMARLQSIFALGPEDRKRRDADPFEVLIHRNDRHETFEAERRETLESLLQNNTVFRIEGKFDDKQQTFHFKIGRRHRHIKLDDPELAGLAVFKEAFGKKGEELQRRGVECGPFGFAFFVFDFSPDAQGARLLSRPDRELIRDHRIYLYRDGIRVYPYGDKDDDWLQIDTRRGTVRAAEFLSNDQVTGYVTITQKENPELRDKTSREGLVDTGHPTEDFIALLQIFLAWVRAKPYNQYRQDLKTKSDVEIFKSHRVQGAFDELLSKADQLPAPMQETLHTAERDYRAERRYLVQRAEATENLAGVGLSVESASHDLQLAMRSSLRTIDTLLGEANRGETLDPEHVLRELQAIRGALSFVDTQLRDLQQLFKSTKQRRKDIRIVEVLEKVVRLFKGMTDRGKIKVTTQTVGSGPLVAKTTDAVLLQLFLNLFDNAVYWLETQPTNKARKIEVVLDSERQQLVFADNGPGITDDDLPYIFEPFYSGKGQEGRGLGLYIARQLLDRHDYRIDVASKRDRVLPGANFLISFVEETQ